MNFISDAALEKYIKIAKLYQTDEFYEGNQSVIISANDLLAITTRLECAEELVKLYTDERLKQLFNK